jgi:hypothetical protein
MTYHTAADLGNLLLAYAGNRPLDGDGVRMFADDLARISAANARAENLRRQPGCNAPEAEPVTAAAILDAARATRAPDLAAAWCTVRYLRHDTYSATGWDCLECSADLDSLLFLMGTVGDMVIGAAGSGELRRAA